MSPEHQAALAELVGRELTEAEIKTLDPLLADPDDRNDVAAAAVLSVGRTKIVSRDINARGLAAHYPGGPIPAERVLMALEGFAEAALLATDPTTKVMGSMVTRQLRFLDRDGLDFGSPALRGMVDALVRAKVIDIEQANNLKALAQAPDPVPVADVSRALNLAEGRMHL